jgi:hypothetical protein
MKNLRKLIALVLTGVFLSSVVVMAGETGRKNTRNALGAATVLAAVTGHKGAAIVGAAGTIAAQVNLNKAIKARHKRQAASNGVSHSYYASGRHYHYYYANGRRYDYFYRNGSRHYFAPART